jgi:hypothetical protein
VLVDGLPPDSAAHRKIPSSRGWTESDFLLAEVVDGARALFELTKAAHFKDVTYEAPTPTPRPGDAERKAAAALEERRQQAKVLQLVDKLLPPGRR